MTTHAQFTLSDDDGAPHHYECRLHPATTGRVLALRIAALGIAPLADVLLSAALAAVRGKKAADLISPEALSKGLESMPGVLDRLANDGKLLDDLFAHVVRDGQPMAHRPAFDAAYTGNYGEMAACLWEVVKANRFFPASRISALKPPIPPKPAQTPAS